MSLQTIGVAEVANAPGRKRLKRIALHREKINVKTVWLVKISGIWLLTSPVSFQVKVLIFITVVAELNSNSIYQHVSD